VDGYGHELHKPHQIALLMKEDGAISTPP